MPPSTEEHKRAVKKYIFKNRDKHNAYALNYYNKVKDDANYKQRVSEYKKRHYQVKKEFRAFLLILLDD